MKRGRAQQRRGERGTQVAELAMVLPLLLFLGLAVTEGEGFVRAHQMLNNAAREGAKFSSLPENLGATAAI
ncbi:MAG: TadE/TadG family type IV pilus assembly protein, partial [Terriglobales bacterium]